MPILKASLHYSSIENLSVKRSIGTSGEPCQEKTNSNIPLKLCPMNAFSRLIANRTALLSYVPFTDEAKQPSALVDRLIAACHKGTLFFRHLRQKASIPACAQRKQSAILAMYSLPGRRSRYTASFLCGQSSCKNGFGGGRCADVEELGPTIRRILLVDDEQAFLEVQSEILRRLGYCVVPNHNAVAALELFAGNPCEFDLIITDEIMPGMTGSEMCRRMRKVRPEIPIIIVTAGLEFARTREKAALCGVRQVLLKPLLKKELRRAIEMAGLGTPAFTFSKDR